MFDLTQGKPKGELPSWRRRDTEKLQKMIEAMCTTTPDAAEVLREMRQAIPEDGEPDISDVMKAMEGLMEKRVTREETAGEA